MVNPDYQDENDITPLSLAMFSSRESVVKLLREVNVDPDSKNRQEVWEARAQGCLSLV